jgi:3-deoxy-D-manno-octulosonic-acid transferase
MFLKAGAGIQVNSPEDLGVAWIELIQDGIRREQMGRAARELVERNRGAAERTLEHVAAVLDGTGSDA